MLNKHRTGTTAENNSWTLPQGMVSIDAEKHGVRLHDGVTPGGYEVLGTRVTLPVPGPEMLSAGTTSLGWYGEAGTIELFTGEELAIEVGLTAGTLINNDAGWLKFALGGKTLFVAKRPLRNALSWNNLNSLALIKGSVTVTKSGYTYRVRLIKGAEADPFSNWDGVGSEWNDLMYRVHVDDPSATNWAAYTNLELGVGGGDGSDTWSQEKYSGSTGNAVIRGGSSITTFAQVTASAYEARFGWRPVLELV